MQGCGCKQLHEDAGENIIAHKRRASRLPSTAARAVLTSSATHNRLRFIAFARFGKGLRKNMAMALAWPATPISSATYNTFDLIFCVFLLFVKRNRKSLCACFTNVLMCKAVSGNPLFWCVKAHTQGFLVRLRLRPLPYSCPRTKSTSLFLTRCTRQKVRYLTTVLQRHRPTLAPKNMFVNKPRASSNTLPRHRCP